MSERATDAAWRSPKTGAVDGLPHDWIIPAWPAPGNVHAFFTTRNAIIDGVRTSAFDVGGQHLPDEPAARVAIAENRRLLQRMLPSPPAWLDQVHGADVVASDRSPSLRDDRWPRADAAVTRVPDVVLAIRVADCVPVLLASRGGQVVGAAHAGWRGMAAGVIERTIDAMQCPPRDILAWIGPCIGATAYEVGDDVRDAFVQSDGDAVAAFECGRPGKWHADLAALAAQRVSRAGVLTVTRSGLCTASDPQRFFSFRRDRATGRMAALIWRAQC